jgi:hypothetical protein
MIPFTPSAQFQAFFDEVIRNAEAPVTAGSYTPVIPDFPDPREQAFAHTKLAELIAMIDRMRKSVTPVAAPSTAPANPEFYGSAP